MKSKLSAVLILLSALCLPVSSVRAQVLSASAAPEAVLTSVPKTIQPNDTFYSRQWYMQTINAPEAWAKAVTTSRDIIVAMIDTGVDDTHPDLKNILWTNPDEKLNGKDDDGDGYIDDIHGWNFVKDTSSTRPIGSYFVADGAWEHGTAVASLIAGRGNDNIGIAGLAWRAKIMPLVILGPDGSGGTERLAQAIKYATAHRADIINISLEGEMEDTQVSDAIRAATANGILVVIAAGNGDGQGYNLDETPLYPACQQGASHQGVLVVSAIRQDGNRFAPANYGSCVHLSAPGDDILAARPTYDPDGNRIEVSGYGSWGGTSLAAPQVSGVGALLKAEHPEWTGEQIAERILETVSQFYPNTDHAGLGAGILNASRALEPANVMTYGPWQLLASEPGKQPIVKITDHQGNNLYTIQVGNPGDHRGLRAAFVRWDEDRYPDIIITSIGDENGAWRVYRRDGILLAAGQVARDANDRILGGLILSSQDITAEARDHVLFSEALGSRIWLITPEHPQAEAVKATEVAKPYGVLAVSIQRPLQAFVLLTRGAQQSRMSILSKYGLDEGNFVTTTHPERLNITHGRTADNRELLRVVQSGPPTDFMEKNDMLEVVAAQNVQTWFQAPLGLTLKNTPDLKMYDVWPR